MADKVIYKITNTVNGKVYIGQTTRPLQERFKRHLIEAKNNTLPDNYFHRAIRKYGADNFVVEQIDSANTQQELNEKEKYWIKYYDSIDNGYNTAEGGEGGNTYKGRTVEQMKRTGQKISEALKGANNGMSKSIKCKSILTNVELKFNTIAECLLHFNCKNKETFTSRAIGKNKLLYKREWIFAFGDNDYITDYVIDYDSSCRNGSKTILKSDKETLTFNSKNKALDFLGLNKNNCKLINGMIIKGYEVLIP